MGPPSARRADLPSRQATLVGHSTGGRRSRALYRSAKLIKGAEEIYKAPPTASRPRIKKANADLLAFIKRNAIQGRRLLEVRFSSKDLAHY